MGVNTRASPRTVPRRSLGMERSCHAQPREFLFQQNNRGLRSASTIGSAGQSMEGPGHRLLQYLHIHLVIEETAANVCAIVWLFKAYLYGELNADGRPHARRKHGMALSDRGSRSRHQHLPRKGTRCWLARFARLARTRTLSSALLRRYPTCRTSYGPEAKPTPTKCRS